MHINNPTPLSIATNHNESAKIDPYLSLKDKVKNDLKNLEEALLKEAEGDNYSELQMIASLEKKDFLNVLNYGRSVIDKLSKEKNINLFQRLKEADFTSADNGIHSLSKKPIEQEELLNNMQKGVYQISKEASEGLLQFTIDNWEQLGRLDKVVVLSLFSGEKFTYNL